MSVTDRDHRAGLDGVRGIAVLLVLLAHGSVRLLPLGVRAGNGWVGVQLFFALSGFLITWLLVRERLATGRVGVAPFAIRRGLRIWPLYFAVLALYALVLPHVAADTLGGVHLDRTDLAAAGAGTFRPYLLFLQNYLDPHQARLGLSVFWSLSVEEHFYLVWPVLVALLPIRWLPRVLAVAAAFSLGLRALVEAGAVHAPSTFHHATHANLTAIGVGGLLGYLAARGQLPDWLRSRTAMVTGWLLLAAAWLPGWAPTAGVPWASGATLVHELAVAGAALVIPHAFAGDRTRHPVLAAPVLVRLGRISFGLYLTHALVLGVVDRWVQGAATSLTVAVGAFGLFLAGAVVLAEGLYTGYERRFLALKDRFRAQAGAARPVGPLPEPTPTSASS